MAEQKEMFDEVDTNKDEILNFEEFVQFQALTRLAMMKRLGMNGIGIVDEEIPQEELLQRQKFVWRAHCFSGNETGVPFKDIEESWVQMENFYKEQ